MEGPGPEGYVEEKTEPFSQSEIEARLKGTREVETDVDVCSNVPLDDLIVPSDKGIRILVLPRTRNRFHSPRGEWLALRAKADGTDQTTHKVLAVSQTSRDINWTARIPGDGEGGLRPTIFFELCFDPFNDNLIFSNRSACSIELCRVSKQLSLKPEPAHVLEANAVLALRPGTWRVKVKHTEILDFRIVEKQPVTIHRASASASSSGPTDTVNPSGKRSFGSKNGPAGPQDKKPRVEGQPLLSMLENDEVEIPGGCEMDRYSIVKREDIAALSPQSSVFKGQHSQVPDGFVTVKVLKTRSKTSAANSAGAERNVMRQACAWLHELGAHALLKHQGIPKLYGGDARCLSLYMEHVDAKDLSAAGHWCSPAEFFMGDRSDAMRILRDTVGALNYIHNRGLAHNDIKPGNILYSRERGAVICDFGLVTPCSHGTSGGTPYYIPPEFLGRKLRGTSSDVWALGVTMLYLLRKMSFPDVRSNKKHPRSLYWVIADINRSSNPAHVLAINRMRAWLDEVGAARLKLGEDLLDRLVFEMVTPQPSTRITIPQLLAQLFPAPDA